MLPMYHGAVTRPLKNSVSTENSSILCKVACQENQCCFVVVFSKCRCQMWLEGSHKKNRAGVCYIPQRVCARLFWDVRTSTQSYLWGWLSCQDEGHRGMRSHSHLNCYTVTPIERPKERKCSILAINSRHSTSMSMKKKKKLHHC